MFDIINDILQAVPIDQRDDVQNFINMMDEPSFVLGQTTSVVDHLGFEVPVLLNGTRLVVDSTGIELSRADASWDGEILTLDDGDTTLHLVADALISYVATGAYGVTMRPRDSL